MAEIEITELEATVLAETNAPIVKARQIAENREAIYKQIRAAAEGGDVKTLFQWNPFMTDELKNELESKGFIVLKYPQTAIVFWGKGRDEGRIRLSDQMAVDSAPRKKPSLLQRIRNSICG